jgi:SAM-dependent methyltransferase
MLSSSGAEKTWTHLPPTQECLPLLERYPEGISEEISPNDQMYNGDPDSYPGLGFLALDCVRLVMFAAQKGKPESILDLPSGHGRVLRALKAEFPEARLTACDLNRDGVDFCAQALGATGVYSSERPADVTFEDRFDLIWCGSLLTHMDRALWRQFLDLFESVLMPGGVLVFTTHGRSILEKWRDPDAGDFYLQPRERREELVRDYVADGFGFAEYTLGEETRESLSVPHSFGISMAQPSWTCRLIESRPGLQLVSYMEGRWGDQDVVGCVRADVGSQPFKAPFGGS